MKYALTALLLFGAACSSSLVNYEARTHIVQPGETLYTIAWRHGVDYRSLAAWNSLSDPDLIFVGQQIRLSALPRSTRSANPRPTASQTVRTPRPLSAPPNLPAPRWLRPTDGTIVSEYGDNSAIASGIWISGRAGQPVVAAASGRIVYAGSGLIGYGQLVIIKHNDTYLSAYGHNRRLLVDQAQEVQRGEQIAEMGLNSQRRPRLHFEIRRNGQPIDPTPLLR